MDWTYTYAKGIPLEAQYLYRKALDLSTLGKYETALRYFRQAVIIAPRFSKACYEMGSCLEKLGQYYEATVLYDRALSIDPLDTDTQNKRDMAIKKRDLSDTGLKFFEKSSVLQSH